MKNTILTEKDTKLIEMIILKYGRIVSTVNLLTIFSTEYSHASAYNRIQILTKTGWLKRIKQGLYIVNESISSRFQNDLSFIAISGAINNDSYVSLAVALNYHQMFDQLSKKIIAITTKESKKYIFDDYTFKFTKVKSEMYFGFENKIESGREVKIADAEKALIDYLYLDKSFSSASLVFEKLKDHQNSINFDKLLDYVLRSNETIKRKIGFFLDQLDLDTKKLFDSLKNKNRGFSRFTVDSKLFNAKWRIYYDDKIIG
jgi:predicted transcriptional regulator of viral defense system